MKLLTLALLTILSTANAFALSATEISKTLADPQVIAVTTGASIESINQEPAPRCMGCFALSLSVYNIENRETGTYKVQGQDFGGVFHVTLDKIN